MNLNLIDVVITILILPRFVGNRGDFDRLAILHLRQILLFWPLKVSLIYLFSEFLDLSDCFWCINMFSIFNLCFCSDLDLRLLNFSGKFSFEFLS